ncbi:hypothetical protein ES332_D02G182400v1 [Gossypium tomentosum]|uniref:Uncharacterized protein n=1 Tax=Gossypium tomentosum TaxID=34277 RepID=A0A5D2LYL0_GOSTO|nr:hypothetical protein ES332_D02G182400v1 [Gossypium tomentosum]
MCLVVCRSPPLPVQHRCSLTVVSTLTTTLSPASFVTNAQLICSAGPPQISSSLIPIAYFLSLRLLPASIIIAGLRTQIQLRCVPYLVNH